MVLVVQVKYKEMKKAGINAMPTIFLALLELDSLTVKSVARIINGKVKVAIVKSYPITLTGN